MDFVERPRQRLRGYGFVKKDSVKVLLVWSDAAEVVMITAVHGSHRFQKGSDLTELAVRATTQARGGTSASAAFAGRDKEGVALSDGVRSKIAKIAELAKTIEAHPDRGATAAGDQGGSRRGTDSVENRLRAVWSEELSGLIKEKEASEKAIRVSREKGEIWIGVPGETDPNKQFYRLQNQPENFEAYMNLREETYKGYDVSIARLTAMIAGTDEPIPTQAGAPAAVDVTV